MVIYISFISGISKQADEELVQHSSSLCPLYHPQREQGPRADRR